MSEGLSLKGIVIHFVQWIVAGIAFGVGLAIVFQGYQSAMMPKRPTNQFFMGQAEVAGKVIASVTEVRVGGDHFVVLGSVKNETVDVLTNAALVVSIFDDSQMIEQCRGNTQVPLPPKESVPFVVNCVQKWPNIEKMKVSAQAKTISAGRQRGNL